VAAKRGVPVAHVEAGLRSRDRTMPEEINRILTDHLSDYLFTPSADADRNLRAEGIPAERIHLVGNVMIDTLRKYETAARAARAAAQFGLAPGRYALLTLHRPSNVDDPTAFGRLLDAVEGIVGRIPVVFPMHPRSRSRLATFGLAGRLEKLPGLHLCPPQGYLAFLSLMMDARLVLTDSGGIQEETTALRVPCLTLRESTERPITVERGTNRVVGTDPSEILRVAEAVLDGPTGCRGIPPLWDGRTAARIVAILARHPVGRGAGA
jgi:UDP-N-acetylglucosamine 2-epimerase (non-hydrolysing)